MNEAQQYSDSGAIMRHAQVNALDGERFGVVSSDGCRYWLTPAFGCVVRPAVGDKVLISLDAESGYILSVLERTISQPSRLQLNGDVQLSVPTGALNIEARDGINVDAGSSLLVRAERGSLQLNAAQMTTTTLNVSGECVDSHWLERNDSALLHTEKAVRHYSEFGDNRRLIEGHEDVHAGSLRQRVKDDWSVQANSLDLNAQRSVAIDGDSIKLG